MKRWYAHPIPCPIEECTADPMVPEFLKGSWRIPAHKDHIDQPCKAEGWKVVAKTN